MVARIADDQDMDLLVNNVWAAPKGFAGFTEKKFSQRPLSDWNPLIGVGLRAHYVASVHAAQLMVPRGSGKIVTISSFGARGHLHSVLYGMSKAGLDKMAAEMAVELAGTGASAAVAVAGSGEERGDGGAGIRRHRRRGQPTRVTPCAVRRPTAVLRIGGCYAW